jgi:hypothetical protein
MKTIASKSPQKAASTSRATRRKKLPPLVEKLYAECAARGGPSVWDMIKDLVVHDENLPTDLSTNPKYLKGHAGNRSR